MKLYSKQQMIKNTLTGILAGAVFASAAVFAIQKNLKSENSEKTGQTQTENVQSQQNSEKAEFVEEVLPQKNIATPAASTVSQYTQDEEQNIFVYEKCNEAVVNITTQVMGINWFLEPVVQDGGSGSGSIIDKRGYVVTNVHVISKANKINISLADGTSYPGTVIGKDIESDIAVLKFDPPENIKLKTIDFGDSSELKVGQKVIAIGNPFALERTMTTGIISGLGRPIQESANVIIRNMIQTDAAINPGNSGGALLNMKGEVIGINSSKYSDTTVEGMGYAIPITAVQDRLDDLMNRQTREKVDESEKGYLGISCATVSSDVSEAYGIPEGVLVTDVAGKSAAEKAGIKANYVITKIDGQSISSAEELTEKLNYYAVGETVPITFEYLKDDAYVEKTVDVTLMENPNADNK